MSKLRDHLTNLPAGATVNWYIPTVSDPGLLSAYWCDTYLCLDEKASIPGVYFQTTEYLELNRQEAVQHGIEITDEDNCPNWNTETGVVNTLGGQLPFLVITPADALDLNGEGCISVTKANELMKTWAEKFLNRGDLNFNYIEEWSMEGDPAWKDLFKSIEEGQKGERYEIAPGVFVSESAFDTLLAIEDPETQAEITRQLSKLSEITKTLNEDQEDTE